MAAISQVDALRLTADEDVSVTANDRDYQGRRRPGAAHGQGGRIRTQQYQMQREATRVAMKLSEFGSAEDQETHSRTVVPNHAARLGRTLTAGTGIFT